MEYCSKVRRVIYFPDSLSTWSTKTIISDRGSQLVSRFWEQLHAALGTTLIRSSAYHPQIDGQTERINQYLEDMLRACVLHYGKNWEGFLPLA